MNTEKGLKIASWTVCGLILAAAAAFGGGFISGPVEDVGLVGDKTPQLGGDLDTNNKKITSTGSDDIVLQLPDNAGARKVLVKDSAGATILSIDSDGDVSMRDLSATGNAAITGTLRPGGFTVAALPGTPTAGDMAWVTDGNAATDCTTGGGSTRVLCQYTGSAWASVGAAGSSNVEDDVYGAGWDSDTTNAPSQNAVYDKIETLEPADAAIAKTDEAETLTADWVNTAYPWADDEVANNISLDNISQITTKPITGLSATNWRMFYSADGAVPVELALGADGTFLESNGAAAAPAFRALLAGDIPDISATYEPADAAIVKSDEAETISTEWTFSAFPITASAAPDADYEVANKKYVDDNIGGVTEKDIVATAPLTVNGTTNVDNALPGADGDITFAVSAATDSATGVSELATDAETVTGTATDRVVTPANVTARLAAPGAIGGTTPAAGTFTTLSAGGGGFAVDADGDITAVKSIAVTASASPAATFNDSDADAVGTGTITANALTATYDSQIIFKVDDSAGEATTYMTIDGSAEQITSAKPIGVTGVVTATGFTIGAAAITEAELEILDGLTGKSGVDATAITGTAGTSGDLAVWNADGDLVDGPTPPAGAIIGTTDTQTLTNKTIDADDNVIQDVPYDIAWSLVDPADADIHYVRLQRAVTLSSIGCIVDPEGTGESVVLNVLECDSNGDTCVTILSSTITCANTPTAGTISDSALAANAFLKIDIGTVTGTVKTLSIYGVGKESY